MLVVALLVGLLEKRSVKVVSVHLENYWIIQRMHMLMKDLPTNLIDALFPAATSLGRLE